MLPDMFKNKYSNSEYYNQFTHGIAKNKCHIQDQDHLKSLHKRNTSTETISVFIMVST